MGTSRIPKFFSPTEMAQVGPLKTDFQDFTVTPLESSDFLFEFHLEKEMLLVIVICMEV